MQYLSGRRVRALVLATSLLLAATALSQQPSFIGGLTPLEDWVGLVDNPIRLASQVERSTQPFKAPSQPFESPTQPFEAPTPGSEEGPSFRTRRPPARTTAA